MFLAPLVAPIVLYIVRFVAGLVSAKAGAASVAFWALLEACSFGVIWVLLGWSLGWFAWRTGFARSINRFPLAIAFVVLIAAFIGSLLARAHAHVSPPFESVALALGALVNLAAFLLLQYAPNPSIERTASGLRPPAAAHVKR